MKIAAKPANEKERLETLQSHQILDTEAERSYDDMARLAAQICETPVALITMVDAERQWFKAKVGTEIKETARDLAFCAHAILQTNTMVVEDSRKDPRFSDNPIVTSSPYVIFYAGAPLVTSTGEGLGTLCVIDHKPRQLKPAQLEALESLARQVSVQLELRKKNLQVTEQLTELKRYHEIVNSQQDQMIQQAKMSALGIMACGVAHEINNPLTIIKTRAYLLKEKTAGHQDAEYISKTSDTISATADRIGKIVKSLQTLSQNEDSASVQKVPLSLIVEEAISLSKIRSVHQDVTLRCNIEALHNIYIEVNPVQFGQVLLNLLNNAFDAVLGLEPRWIELRAEIRDDNVLVQVIDSGKGLPKAAIAHLFQPFFTTKEIGAGTGLGLALSRKMVEKQKGVLEYVESEANTTFQIKLPKIG